MIDDHENINAGGCQPDLFTDVNNETSRFQLSTQVSDLRSS